MASASQVGALIPQGTAYGLLIGLGVLFCAVVLLAVKVQKAYLAEDSATSEMFMVANRSVGTGLTASAVFSSWMWINETVLAAAMCYRYGLAVPVVSGRDYNMPVKKVESDKANMLTSIALFGYSGGVRGSASRSH